MTTERATMSDRYWSAFFWLLAITLVTVRGVTLGVFVGEALVVAAVGIVGWLRLRHRFPFPALHALQTSVACAVAAGLVPLLTEASFRLWRQFFDLEAMFQPPLIAWIRATTVLASAPLLLPIAGLFIALVGRRFVPGFGYALRPLSHRASK